MSTKATQQTPVCPVCGAGGLGCRVMADACVQCYSTDPLVPVEANDKWVKVCAIAAGPSIYRPRPTTAGAVAVVGPPRADDAVPGAVRAALRLTCAADVEQRPLAWLWPGRLPLGKLTTLMGNPKLGKSVLLLDIAARVSRGAGWPDTPDAPRPEPADVLIFSAEDGPEDTIAPRLAVAEADLRRVHLVTGVVEPREKCERCFRLDRDMPHLEAVLESRPAVRLVVIDPVSSFLGEVDSHVNAAVRGALAPLSMLAAKHRVAVVCLTHLTKAPTQKAIFRALGSVAFSAVSRAVWAVAEDPHNPARRLLLNAGGNLTANSDGLAFTLQAAESNSDHPFVAWAPDPVSLSADEVFAPAPGRPGPDAAERVAATDWLRAALAQGPRMARELIGEATDGQGLAKRTLERARSALGVVAYRESVPGPWWWRLPGPGQDRHVPEHKQLGDLGGLAKTSSETPCFGSENPKTAKFPECGNVGGPTPDDRPPDYLLEEAAAGAGLDGDEVPL